MKGNRESASGRRQVGNPGSAKNLGEEKGISQVAKVTD